LPVGLFILGRNGNGWKQMTGSAKVIGREFHQAMARWPISRHRHSIKRLAFDRSLILALG